MLTSSFVSESFVPSLRLHKLLIVASVIVPAGLFVGAAWQDQRAVQREGRETVTRTVAILQEHARKVFETEELALARVDDRVRGQSWAEIDSPATSEFLAKLKAGLEQAVSIWISSADGKVRAGSQAWDHSVSIAEREFFAAQKDRDAGTMVSAAFRGKATHKPSFAVSRRRSTPDGTFDGVIHISLSPEYFQHFFAEAAPSIAHQALLLRSAGDVLARDPPDPDADGRLSPDGDLMRQIRLHPDGATFVGCAAPGGVERLYAFRKIGAYPVYVVFGIDTAALQATWHANLALFGAAAGMAALLLVVMSWLALRTARAQQLTAERLRVTVAALERETAQREAAEGQVRQVQKMEAVGQLTGGIAHDFNNLLTAVMGNLQLLRKHVTGNPTPSRLLENAMAGAQRGAALTQRLLAFGRRQALRPEPVDIPTLVRGMADLLQSSLGSEIEIETHFPMTLPPAFVDANQLELALLNLAVNARDAMGGQGSLVIAARSEPAGPAVPPDCVQGAIVLSVTDSGAGMDEETLARAVEPFFTTKGVGKGTGLGLSMVHGLAAQSGGRLDLTSKPGAGTTAALWLPRAPATPAVEVLADEIGRDDLGPARQRLRPEGRTLTVLVVDDDPLVLASTAAMLDDLGHAPVEAGSARQALEILKAGAEVDLVVADQSMPQMTGRQMAELLARRSPDLPVVLASGYPERAEVAEAGVRVLPKPFDQGALQTLLSEIGARRDRPAHPPAAGDTASVLRAVQGRGHRRDA